jgi:RNA polymerase sigma factor, sigma-70 family
LEDTRVDLLEDLTERENMDELLDCLTERQKMAASLCFFQQKSRKEAAKELGITNSAVSIILSQAVRRLRKKYLSKDQTEKVVAVV